MLYIKWYSAICILPFFLFDELRISQVSLKFWFCYRMVLFIPTIFGLYLKFTYSEKATEIYMTKSSTFDVRDHSTTNFYPISQTNSTYQILIFDEKWKKLVKLSYETNIKISFQESIIFTKMSRKCCCCIPVVVGAAILGLIALLFCASESAVLIPYLAQFDIETFNPIQQNLNDIYYIWWFAMSFKLCWIGLKVPMSNWAR